VPGSVPAPNDIDSLRVWIRARMFEPSPTWTRRARRAAYVPHSVNLPGMDAAAAAVVARYSFMPDGWCADVLQDFMGRWLLRSESAETIARSALQGVGRGIVGSVDQGIAWKLRMELLSQAHRAYRRHCRERRVIGAAVRLAAARMAAAHAAADVLAGAGPAAGELTRGRCVGSRRISSSPRHGACVADADDAGGLS